MSQHTPCATHGLVRDSARTPPPRPPDEDAAPRRAGSGPPPMRSSPGRSTGGRMSVGRCSASGNVRSPTAVNPLPRGLRVGPAPPGDSGDRPCGNGCCGPAGRLTRDPLPARRDACGPLVAEHQSRGRIDQNDLAVVQPVSNRIGQCTTYEDYIGRRLLSLLGLYRTRRRKALQRAGRIVYVTASISARFFFLKKLNNLNTHVEIVCPSMNGSDVLPLTRIDGARLVDSNGIRPLPLWNKARARVAG